MFAALAEAGRSGGSAAREAGRRVRRRLGEAVEKAYKARYGTFGGAVSGRMIEEMGKSPKIAEEAAKLPERERFISGLKKTLESGASSVSEFLSERKKKFVQRHSRNPFVQFPIAAAATIAEGSVTAGKILGQEAVGRYVQSPVVEGTRQIYAAGRSVAAPNIRAAGRSMGRFRRDIAGTRLGRLFGATPEERAAMELAPRTHVLTGKAGTAGRFRTAMAGWGLGTKTRISDLNMTLTAKYNELRDLHRNALTKVQAQFATAGERFDINRLTSEQRASYRDQVKSAMRGTTQRREELRKEIYQLLRVKRAGGVDVDRGHYLAGAGVVGFLAGRELKEFYDKYKGTRDARESERMFDRLERGYKLEIAKRNPTMSSWDVDRQARAQINLVKAAFEEQQSKDLALQSFQNLQRLTGGSWAGPTALERAYEPGVIRQRIVRRPIRRRRATSRR